MRLQFLVNIYLARKKRATEMKRKFGREQRSIEKESERESVSTFVMNVST